MQKPQKNALTYIIYHWQNLVPKVGLSMPAPLSRISSNASIASGCSSGFSSPANKKSDKDGSDAGSNKGSALRLPAVREDVEDKPNFETKCLLSLITVEHTK